MQLHAMVHVVVIGLGFSGLEVAKALRRVVIETAVVDRHKWDRFFGTYIAQPAKGHEDMEIAIEQFRTRRDFWLDRMLIQPLRRSASGHALDPSITRQKAAE